MLPAGHLGVVAGRGFKPLQRFIEWRPRFDGVGVGYGGVIWGGGAIAVVAGGCCGHRVVAGASVVDWVVDLGVVGGLGVVRAGGVHLKQQ